MAATPSYKSSYELHRDAVGNQSGGGSLALLYGTSTSVRQPSIAIATVHTVGRAQSSGCDILKWCFSASAFANAPDVFPAGVAEAVVLTNNFTWAVNECRTRGVRMIASDPALAELVQRWGDMQPWPGSSHKRSRTCSPRTLGCTACGKA